MHSAIYEGVVTHHRVKPRPHQLRMGIEMLFLDLSELDSAFAGRWFWSSRRWAIARFHRSDHFGDSTRSLDSAVRAVVAERLGRSLNGPIRLLTFLRYWGYAFNPISLYFCYAPGGEELDAILAEVSNTPWGERHLYVLDPRKAASGLTMRFRNDKEFHVSPFMPMDAEYCWRITPPGRHISVDLGVEVNGERIFGANLELSRIEINGANLARSLWRHPFMSGRVVVGIYWHALRLWLKGCPIFNHPKPNEIGGSVIRGKSSVS